MTLREWLHYELFVGALPDGRLTLTNRILIAVILLAVITAVLATEPTIHTNWSQWFPYLEFIFGIIFLIEYLARIYAAAEQEGTETTWQKRFAFIKSPIGLIDLAVVFSALLPLITADAAMLRFVRLLRVLAVMKFGRFNQAIKEVWGAIKDRGDDLLVTIAMAFMLLLFGATALFIIEGGVQPEAFGSVPRAFWWAVITFTTVGYGDVYPITVAGKACAIFMALTGVAFVAMPTGIVAAAFSEAMQRRRDQRIEEMRKHLERLDKVDQRVQQKLAALERTGN